MIVAFCGHSDYIEKSEHRRIVLNYLENAVGNQYCDFFLGEYGRFDEFAYTCAQEFKENHKRCRLIYITPYLQASNSALDKKYQVERFDDVIYPELENVPLRYAISHRNRWIIEKSDIVITYVVREFGGAYVMYRQAKRKRKIVFNIATVCTE